MSITLSERVRSLKPSSTVAVTNLAKSLQAAGEDVLSFAAGEPDFQTPEVVKQAAKTALDAGLTKYMPTPGDPETRSCIAEKLTRENGISGLTGDHVAISVGGKHSLYLTMHCLLDPPAPGGVVQEVLTPVPAWVSYDPIVTMAGGRLVGLETSVESEFKITAAQLRAAITPRTRALILNSPSNPCGVMYTPDELRAIAQVVHETRDVAPDLVVITDEIYEKIVYGGVEHFSIGSVPEIADRVITLNGLSKAFAMTGWRVGYAAAPGDSGAAFIKAVAKMQGQMTTSIPAFIYPAIRTALTSCSEDVERFRAAFAQRAVRIHDRMVALPGVRCPRPTGAFYVFPDMSACFGRTSPGGTRIESAGTFAEALLKDAKVAAVPGEDFGGCGPNHLRFSFACSESQIDAGMDRLAGFVDSLS